MIQPLRQAHWWWWLVITVALPLLLVLVLRARPPQDIIQPLEESSVVYPGPDKP